MLSSLVQPKDDLRQKLNDKFFEELANLRYGDNSEEKQKYDNIGEKFAFWKHLSDAQKRICIVDPSNTIRSKQWNVSNGIKISDEEKSEFLKQRRPLHEITCRSLLERLLKASETDKARLVPIEKPLANAFAAFSLYFDQFHCATLSIPESDIFIKGWFDRKHAELRNKTFGNQHTAQEGTSETGDIQDHPAASLVIDVQKRRHQILNRNYLRDMQAFAKHLGAFQQKPMGGNVSGILPNSVSSANSTGNVLQCPSSEISNSFTFDPTKLGHNQPSTIAQIPRNAPKPRTMVEELLTGKNMSSSSIRNPLDAFQVSVENQATQKASVSDVGQSSPEIVLVNITHPDSIGNRSVLQSRRAAPKPKVPATIFHSTRTNELQVSVRPENSVMDGRKSEGSRIRTNARKRSLSSIEESVGRDGGEHSPINVPTSSNLAKTHRAFFYSIDDIARIARVDVTRVEENLATNSSRRKQSAPKKSRIDQSANETGKETGCVSGDAQRTILPMNSRIDEAGNTPQTSQLQTAATGSRDILAGVLAKKMLPATSEIVNLGEGQFWNQASSWNPSISGVNSRSAPQIRSDVQPEVRPIQATASNPGRTHGIRDSIRTETSGIDASTGMDTKRLESRIGTHVPRSLSSRMEKSVENSLLLKIVEDATTTNDLIGIYNDFPQGIFSVPDSSHLSAPRKENQPSTSAEYRFSDAPAFNFFAPTSLGPLHQPLFNNQASSSRASSSSLPISMPADDVTHEAALSIAPPPRMVSSIMNHLATQLKKREENGCLDFSQIEVNLKATGKELDDTLFFLKNLTAQVESAKQGGSFQQL